MEIQDLASSSVDERALKLPPLRTRMLNRYILWARRFPLGEIGGIGIPTGCYRRYSLYETYRSRRNPEVLNQSAS